MPEFQAILQSAAPKVGERVLCLAPPGDLGDVLRRFVARATPEGRVVGLVRGDPWIQADIPPGVEVHDGIPERPSIVRGPFDLVAIWGSTPFLDGLEPLLAPIYAALRPGGRLAIDLPAYGFSPVLQACDPRAAGWCLPSVATFREALTDQGFRDVQGVARIDVTTYETLAELLGELARPVPLAFEGPVGNELTATLRANLARAFEGDTELSLARRHAAFLAIR